MASNPNQKQAAELDKVGTILGPESHFEGNLKAPNSVRVDGELVGDIETPGDVYIGEVASCTGNVTCRNLYHCGYLKGDVMAEGRIELSRTAKLIGNSTMSNLITEPGSELVGSCRTLNTLSKEKEETAIASA